MKIAYSLLTCLFLTTGVLEAQITIETSTANSMFSPGSGSSVIFADSFTLDNFSGQTGENQTWDFSNVTWPDTAAFTQLSQTFPSGTLLENESFFQMATNTFHTSVNFAGVDIVSDQYFTVTSDGVDLLGFASNDDYDGDGDLEVGATYYTPGDRILSFPMTLGTSWQSEFIPTVFANGTEVNDLGERTTHTITGWGQANAAGITADCLRDDFKTELACASGAGYCGETDQINLYCIPQTDGPLYFYIVFLDVNSDGSIGDLSMWTFDSSLVLSSETDLPSSLSKINAYPNPFQASVNLRFESKRQGSLSVEIYDLLGQKIDVISHQEIAPGDQYFEWLPASHIPNGTYIIELRHNGVASHEKVVLLR